MKIKLTKSVIITSLLLNSIVSLSNDSESRFQNLNYELKLGITPYEAYNSSRNSERFNDGVDFGLEVYKPWEKYSLGFGGEVKRDADPEFITGDHGRVYAYYLLGKRKITDSYSLVARLGRTSQNDFDSKFYGAFGIEKNINRVNIQVLYEQTKLENNLNNKKYSAVGVKFGYVFGDQYKPVIAPPIEVLEEIPAAPPLLVIEGNEISGGYPAYSIEVPEVHHENITNITKKLNDYNKPGVLQITAYSDNTGSKEVNVDLANKRMDNLKNQFMENNLTNLITIETTDPHETVKNIYKFNNDTFRNRELNRRIEVTFIEEN